jgi:hypothetical protein
MPYYVQKKKHTMAIAHQTGTQHRNSQATSWLVKEHTTLAAQQPGSWYCHGCRSAANMQQKH